MTISEYKKIIAKLIKAYHKKYDAFGNKKRKGKKRAKR
jgi:hypothetical protein